MTKFHIGEIAVFWNPGGINHMKEVIVTGPMCYQTLTCTDTLEKVKGAFYPVVVPESWEHGQFMRDNAKTYLQVKHLVKRIPPQTLTTWENCAWKPLHLRKS